MKNWKKLMLSLLIFLLILPGCFTTVSAKGTSEENGIVSSKDEVVYATLNATGSEKKVYVVNMLDVTKAGNIIDYGEYSNLKNLTDSSKLKQSGNQIKVNAPKGKFYYQGNMENTNLPWDFAISYSLDGKDIAAKDLAGKNGNLEIKIQTKANKDVDSSFFKNYLLQISLTFDTEKTSKLSAKDGMIANAGKNQQVTFTVMPEQEETLTVKADVEDFELDGIDITGVPSTMSIDPPDVDEMTGDMDTLVDAITEVNNGVGNLKYGVTQLNSGAAELKNGSGQYNTGIAKLDRSSGELVRGSEEINKALSTMSDSLSGIKEMDFSNVEKLTNGFGEMSNGLREAANGLSTLKDHYTEAYTALDGAMQAIPAYNISDEDIQALSESDADQETVKQLLETYAAARKAKGTYDQVKQGFDAVGSTLESVIQPLNKMADSLEQIQKELAPAFGNTDMADGLVKLKNGIAQLARNYQSFHAGLQEYTGGVHQLSNSYQELNNGIAGLSSGTNELENGVSELHKGTAQLERSTSDLPKKMTEEIDKMIAEYDKSDFDAISFVSSKNKDVYSVQFVLKTEKIKKEEEDSAEKPKEEKKGIWERFKDLFSK